MIAHPFRYWPSIAAVLAVGGLAWLSRQGAWTRAGSQLESADTPDPSASAERLGQCFDGALAALLAAETVARLEEGLDWDLSALTGSSTLSLVELDEHGASLHEIALSRVECLSPALREFESDHVSPAGDPGSARAVLRWSSVPAGLRLCLFTTRGTQPSLFYAFESSPDLAAPLVRDDGWNRLVHGGATDAAVRRGWSCYVLDENARDSATLQFAMRGVAPFLTVELAYSR